MGVRALFFWVPLFFVFLCLSPAHADNGDVVFSLEAGGDVSSTAGFVATVRYGLSDELSLESGLGATLIGGDEPRRQGALGSLGGVLALDVLAWVPELTAGVGSNLVAGEFEPFAYGGLKIRWVLDFNWSLFVGGEGILPLTNLDFSGRGCVGVSYQLD